MVDRQPGPTVHVYMQQLPRVLRRKVEGVGAYDSYIKPTRIVPWIKPS